MPKDRRSSSLDRCRASPYSRRYRNADKRKPRTPVLPVGDENEWEEVRCPICMEHPHNAVLLCCSSREKGCRPYMCDTSSRHSNCLDQFRKSSVNPGEQTKLVCPLCRGQVNGWIVVDPARKLMDSKARSCSLDTCDFSGNYSQIRKHARCKHPRVRPTDIGPEKELEWRSLEEDLEQQDIFSMQFEFDGVDDETIDELMDGVSDLASPIGDYDMDFMSFLSTFDAENDSVFPEFDWASEDDSSIFLEDWSNMFSFSTPYESDSRESVWSRATARNNNRLPPRLRENGPTTRSRTNAHRRQRANSPSSSRNHQEQVTTLFEFHDLSSDLP